MRLHAFMAAFLAAIFVSAALTAVSGTSVTRLPEKIALLDLKFEDALLRKSKEFSEKRQQLRKGYRKRLQKIVATEGAEAAAASAELRVLKQHQGKKPTPTKKSKILTPPYKGAPEVSQLRRQFKNAKKALSVEKNAIHTSLAVKYIELLEGTARELEEKGNTSATDIASTIAALYERFPGAAQLTNTSSPKTASPILAPDSIVPTNWPKEIALNRHITVTTVREDVEKKIFIYRTKHFEFEADAPLRINLVREFSRVFEATYKALDELPLGLSPRPPKAGHFKTRLFVNEKDYFAAGGPKGSAGVFLGNRRLIMVPLCNLGVKKVGRGFSKTRNPSANHTLIHEITHQVMVEWLPLLPVWYTEGIAEYMASTPYRNGRFNFTNPARSMRDYLKSFKGVWEREATVAGIDLMFAKSYTDWMQSLTSKKANRGLTNYATAGLMAVYFHHLDGDGKGTGIRRYLAALQQGVSQEVATKKYLLRERSSHTVETAMAKQWRRHGLGLHFLKEPAIAAPLKR